MTPYLIIDTTLLEAMIFAAKRNVDVEIIVPKHYDHFITFCVGRTFIKTLIKNGIKIYEYEPGFIHAKSFVSDDELKALEALERKEGKSKLEDN